MIKRVFKIIFKKHHWQQIGYWKCFQNIFEQSITVVAHVCREFINFIAYINEISIYQWLSRFHQQWTKIVTNLDRIMWQLPVLKHKIFRS